MNNGDGFGKDRIRYLNCERKGVLTRVTLTYGVMFLFDQTWIIRLTLFNAGILFKDTMLSKFIENLIPEDVKQPSSTHNNFFLVFIL